MKHLKWIVVMFGFALFLLNACEEAVTNTADDKNPTPETFFPLTQNSEWEYDQYKLDVDGNVQAGTIKSVRTKISGSKDFLGITYSGLITYENGVATGTEYYYSDGSKLYVTKNEIAPKYDGMDISFFVDKLPETVIIADVDTDKWTLLDDSVVNHILGIGFGGVDIAISGAVLITCEKGQTDNIKLTDSSEVNAQEFIIEYSFDGMILGIEPFELTIRVHRWYAANMGFVLGQMDSETITVKMTFMGQTIEKTMQVEGYKIVAKKITIAE